MVSFAYLFTLLFGRYFIKASEGAQKPVTCTAAKGVSQDFSVKDCVAASHQLAEKRPPLPPLEDARSGHTLEKTTRQILKSCVKSVSEKEASTNDKGSLKIDHNSGDARL
ncbi:hypothetical protein H4Q26_011270 [Puccinia striiformis f. sp. tritici PST-130]|nr:hypothetical protein H4Q26_011270 [Puccinia striiformis f. sp. tritici PST-130]